MTLVQVVLTGAGAEKVKAGMKELAYKRDELVDKMRWSVRQESGGEVKSSKEADEPLGESSIARQAARLLLSARQAGGWVAGKVDVQSFLYTQTA